MNQSARLIGALLVAPAAWLAAVVGVVSAVALYLDLHERDRLEIEAKFVLVALILIAAGLLIVYRADWPGERHR